MTSAGPRSGRPGEPLAIVVGGGLAGLAAAVRLAEAGLPCTLLETRRVLGGRAGSFIHPESGELVDHCQHVALGCCTSFLDFCQRTKIDGLLRRDRTVHFFGPHGKRYDLQAARWLPAPAQLGPSLAGLGFLAMGQRLATARALWRLARRKGNTGGSFADWLAGERAPPEAIRRFWSVVLVSALGETVERVAFEPARKVFVEGFLSSHSASDVIVPTVSLGEFYDERVGCWLEEHGVTIRRQACVESLSVSDRQVTGVITRHGELNCSHVVLALPWRRLPEVIPSHLHKDLPAVAAAKTLQSSPITAIHLWLDRDILNVPHAVLVEGTVQWVFARGESSSGYYYQVVISASRDVVGRPRAEVLDEVLADLRRIWPRAREANVRSWQMISQSDAVFSVSPTAEAMRPSQRTEVNGLYLAGDWTQTGWPATMEGAVRSGYLAAAELLSSTGRPRFALPDELTQPWCTRWLWR